MPRRKCQACRRWFMPSRSDARFCSAACRQRAYRRRVPPSGRIAEMGCDFDYEHDKDYDSEPERQSHLRAAQWQLWEALRLANEFALFRNGAPKVSRRMLTRVRAVVKRWRRLAAELAQKRGG